MTASMNLNILPIGMTEGLVRDGLLSLSIGEAPPFATPSRRQDQLLLYFVMGGEFRLRPDQQKQILEYINEIFYKTSGSVTAAMRRTHEELNKILLEIKTRYTPGSPQGLGWLSSLVLHRGQIYLAQSGPMSTYILRRGISEILSDNSMVVNGLGHGQDTQVNYLQVEAEPEDMLIMAALPSTLWRPEVFDELRNLDLTQITGLISRSLSPELNLVFIKVGPGDGRIQLVSVVEEEDDERRKEIPAAVIAANRVISSGDQVVQDPGQLQEDGIKSWTADLQEQSEGNTTPVQEIAGVGDETAFHEPASQQLEESKIVDETGAVKKQPGSATKRSFLVLLGFKLSNAGEHIKPLFRPFNAVWRALSPGEDFFHIPSATMALIALFVPILVVTAASIAYLQLGRKAQYDVLYSQAQSRAQQAEAQTDIQMQHLDWEEALQLLDQVETISITPESQALRAKVVNTLDKMDLVKRVDFQPAIIGGLPESARVTRMVVVDNDLFMLDAQSGNVLRAQLTSQGYRLDTSFMCGANQKEEISSGGLVDIERWPNSYQPEAEIIAMDSAGTIQFCGTDQSPQVARLSPGALSPMNRLAGMTMSQGDLYVLDPQENAVWIYWNGEYASEPQLFFDIEIPPLHDVVDLAVNNDELYLLHKDGSITLCVFSGLGVAPTRCSKPDYIDYRPGRENTAMVMEQPFTQILFNPPPDPSLLLLNSGEGGIYHFSLRNLAYQKKYLSLIPMPDEEATAFAIDPIKRNFFEAQGEKVYYGVMP